MVLGGVHQLSHRRSHTGRIDANQRAGDLQRGYLGLGRHVGIAQETCGDLQRAGIGSFRQRRQQQPFGLRVGGDGPDLLQHLEPGGRVLDLTRQPQIPAHRQNSMSGSVGCLGQLQQIRGRGGVRPACQRTHGRVPHRGVGTGQLAAHGSQCFRTTDPAQHAHQRRLGLVRRFVQGSQHRGQPCLGRRQPAAGFKHGPLGGLGVGRCWGRNQQGDEWAVTVGVGHGSQRFQGGQTHLRVRLGGRSQQPRRCTRRAARCQDAENGHSRCGIAAAGHLQQGRLDVRARDLGQRRLGRGLDRTAAGGRQFDQAVHVRRVAQLRERFDGGRADRLIFVLGEPDRRRCRRAIAAFGQHAQQQHLARRVQLRQPLDQRGGHRVARQTRGQLHGGRLEQRVFGSKRAQDERHGFVRRDSRQPNESTHAARGRQVGRPKPLVDPCGRRRVARGRQPLGALEPGIVQPDLRLGSNDRFLQGCGCVGRRDLAQGFGRSRRHLRIGVGQELRQQAHRLAVATQPQRIDDADQWRSLQPGQRPRRAANEASPGMASNV